MSSIPQKLTDLCKEAEAKGRHATIGGVALLSRPDDLRSLLTDEASFDKGGEIWKAVADLIGANSLITMPAVTAEQHAAWSQARAQFSRRVDMLSETALSAASIRFARSIERKLVRHSALVDLETEVLKYTGEVIAGLWDIDQATMAEVLPRIHLAMGGTVRQMIGSLLPAPVGKLIQPRTFERVCSELRELLGDRHDELCTAMAAGRDTVGAALCWHLLRDREDGESIKSPARTIAMYPPIWFLPRRATKATTISTGTIKAGQLVLLLPYAAVRIHPTAELLAFGYGPRRCAGARPALRMLAAAAAAVTHLEFNPHGDRSPVGRITLWPKDAKSYVRRVIP